MTSTFTTFSYTVPSASSANLAAWLAQLTNAFVQCGGSDHVLVDTVTVSSAVMYNIVECTINNLGNAYSKFYYRIEASATNVGFSHSITTYETWDTALNTGTNASPVRNSAGAFPGNNGGASFTVAFQIFRSAESRVIAMSQNGSYQVSWGYHIPVSRPPIYDRAMYNYYVLLDPNNGGGTITYPTALVLPPRNPWTANMAVSVVSPASMTQRDSATLQIPTLRGAHLYNATLGAAVGGMSPDFVLMPVAPLVAPGDRITDTGTSEIFRPITYSTTYLSYGLQTNA